MCTSPLTAYENPEGGKPLFGYWAEADGGDKLKLPCGKCTECLRNYYMGRAVRGHRELLQWDSSIFITLTLDDKHNDGSLHKKDHPYSIVNFIKRLKKHFKSCKDNPIRQIYCGEYGETTQRPHYHAVIFNCDFHDKRRHYITDQGHQVYTSDLLAKLWKFGHSEFGYATPATIGYLYKYILKKKSAAERKKPLIINGKQVEHEFIEASRNPGIGASLKNSDSLNKGYITCNGVKFPLSKYYMDHLKENAPDVFAKLKQKNLDYISNQPIQSEQELKMREEAKNYLTDTKRKM